MTKIFRVLIQVEELISNEFKRIISLERTTKNEPGIILAIADYHGQVSEFVEELIEKGRIHAT